MYMYITREIFFYIDISQENLKCDDIIYNQIVVQQCLSVEYLKHCICLNYIWLGSIIYLLQFNSGDYKFQNWQHFFVSLFLFHLLFLFNFFLFYRYISHGIVCTHQWHDEYFELVNLIIKSLVIIIIVYACVLRIDFFKSLSVSNCSIISVF